MLKTLIISYAIVLSFSIIGQEKDNKVILSVSPAVDQSDSLNNEIITLLRLFLNTKNESYSENDYWIKSDFQKYTYPYLDIFKIEGGKYGPNHYQPALMEILNTESENQRIIKLAFIGHHAETNENTIRIIYNIMVEKTGNNLHLKRVTDYKTRKWTTIEKGSITYKISDRKSINTIEINQQIEAINKLCSFFDTEAIPIYYYSCINPVELFQIKGFDYHPGMYIDTIGGMIDFGNNVYSGNNSEIYTHEIVHIYTKKVFPGMNALFDEGIATIIGGSGKSDYKWHKQNLKGYLNEHKIDFLDFTQPYKRFDINGKTSVAYMTGALICERTLRVYGPEKLFTLFKNKSDLWLALKTVGLTQENFSSELKKEAFLVPFLPY